MDFDSVLENARSETSCSQVFIHFAIHQPVWVIVQRVEDLGGEIIGMEIRDSDRAGYKISLMRLANENIQDVVVALSEDGLSEVQGIGRRNAE